MRRKYMEGASRRVRLQAAVRDLWAPDRDNQKQTREEYQEFAQYVKYFLRIDFGCVII